ncbi:conserved protein of unknown function [Candidatus Promineifilum breve]|uniref:Uncharacterized protein n=1 Tax=Candidatus Promineifilum breve TaxID=1806508 RepID=A0A160T6U1_9CHLR|nr:conserved protein of unknown function [Candidatus Promineifilum breve]CUS05754.1 conserved protein of unknown function [Candidatus Promineifilum breve]CUS05881.1 conserved protein of unknown function [Candidatus Promineifilum breve]
MKPRQVTLSAAQVAELQAVRDHAPVPYLRERAAAILKVVEGRSVRQVALHGLYRRRGERTVAAWLNRYLAEGVAGLEIRPGRGRKPAFSPSDGDGGRRGRRPSAAPVAPPVRD